MNLRKFAFFLVLAGALAAGTLFLASLLFTELDSWVKLLPEAQVKLLPSIFAILTVLFIGLGVFLRRRTNSSENEL